jgi:drug/metabolite transporter (DMT)-like permease
LIKKPSLNAETDKSLFVFLLIISMAIWGGSWTSAKLVANTVSPFVLTFLRFILSFLSFIPFVFIFKEKLKIGMHTFILILLSSLLLVSYNILFFFGLKTGLAGAGGVLVTTINPIFTFLFSMIIFKKKITKKEIGGLFLGFAGGLVLLEVWNTNFDKLFASGNLIFITASLIWAILTISGGEIQKKTSIFVFSFYLYGISSLVEFFVALPFGLKNVMHMNFYFWFNIFYLSIISTFFATSIYFFSSRKISANKTSSFILLVPIFAVVISFFVLNEIPKISTITGGVLAMAAIYLINKVHKEN